MAIEIGRLAIKIAGRDAGRECLIIDNLKDGLVLIDGNTRRRKCSLSHLDLQDQIAKVKKGAEHAEVISALNSLGIHTYEKPLPKFQKENKVKKSKLNILKRKEKTKPVSKKESASKKLKNSKKITKTKAKVKKESSPKKD